MNRELESFSYSVSHDLRAPLRHVDGFARILKEEHSAKMAPEAIRYLDRILTAATHMGQLIDDLLNLAKIGRLELRRERAQIARVGETSDSGAADGSAGTKYRMVGGTVAGIELRRAAAEINFR